MYILALCHLQYAERMYVMESEIEVVKSLKSKVKVTVAF